MRLLFLFLSVVAVGIAAGCDIGKKTNTNTISQGEKMETINQTEPIYVVGIELKTSNDKAFKEIPLHWQKFYQESILDKIPNKVSHDVYAVYTNFQNEGKNNEGVYSFIIGSQVKNLDQVPPTFVATTIPKSNRQVFKVPAGHPEKVGEKWQEIWNTNIKKTYIADYERYQESGDISIFIGIK